MKTTYTLTIILLIFSISLLGQETIIKYVPEGSEEKVVTVPDSAIHAEYSMQENGNAYHAGPILVYKGNDARFKKWHAVEWRKLEIWLNLNKGTGKIEPIFKPMSQYSVTLIPTYLMIMIFIHSCVFLYKDFKKNVALEVGV
jgi:hypothetical protein